MMQRGAQALSEAELLALIIQTGAVENCRRLLSAHGGLSGLSRSSISELRQGRGIGLARACALSATFEIARRLEQPEMKQWELITCSADAYRLLKPRLTRQRQELFMVISLDAKHRLLSLSQVAQGTTSYVDVHPREVFSPLVREGATALIVAHNHPSGDLQPSVLDQQLTSRLKQIGELLGITLLDHLICADNDYLSLADQGLF